MPANTPESVFVATSAYLFLKMHFNSFFQGYARARGSGFKYPEDRLFDSSPKPEEQIKKMEDLEWRATACWRNDLENIPLFFVAALCGLMSGIPLPAYKALLVAFCIARTLHSASLLFGRQPWRFIFFLVGMCITSTLFVWSLSLQGWG